MISFSVDQLLELHNEARKRGSWMWSIQPLQVDDKLMIYASNHAKHMANINSLKHSSMRGILALGFNRAGENIAWGQKTPESVMRAWLTSPGHRLNIMSTSYNKIGYAVAECKKGRLYWCVVFGKN